MRHQLSQLHLLITSNVFASNFDISRTPTTGKGVWELQRATSISWKRE